MITFASFSVSLMVQPLSVVSLPFENYESIFKSYTYLIKLQQISVASLGDIKCTWMERKSWFNEVTLPCEDVLFPKSSDIPVHVQFHKYKHKERQMLVSLKLKLSYCQPKLDPSLLSRINVWFLSIDFLSSCETSPTKRWISAAIFLQNV